MVAIFGLPGGTEWVVVGLVALLLFGRRLPEVAKSLGKGIVEFKKGLRSVEDEVHRAGEEPPEVDIDTSITEPPPQNDSSSRTTPRLARGILVPADLQTTAQSLARRLGNCGSAPPQSHGGNDGRRG